MTELFARKIVEKSVVVGEVLPSPQSSLSLSDDSHFPPQPPTSEPVEEVIDPAEVKEGLDLGGVLDGLVGGDGGSAVDGIRELTHKDDNLPMKSILVNPGAFTAAQILADYNDVLGLGEVGAMLRKTCEWHYQHGCALKGKRSEQAFAAYTGEREKEFLLEKEAKGLLKR